MLPDSFVAGVVRERGALSAERWISTLDGRVDHYCQAWRLKVSGAPSFGYIAMVLPVVRGKHRYALKLAWPDEQVVYEVRALRLWAGDHAVQVVRSASRDGVVLLEGLNPDQTLHRLPIDRALVEAGVALRRLSHPGTCVFPSLDERLRELARGVRAHWLAAGRPFAVEAVGAIESFGALHRSRPQLTNEDLHFGNVLQDWSGRWCVIDPKPLLGDVEYGVFPLLRERPAASRQEFSRRRGLLEAEAELDSELVTRWLLVRSAEYLLWAAQGQSADDATPARRILEWVL